jgi:hypothetical protein
MHKLFIILLVLTLFSCRRNRDEELSTKANITVRDRETLDSLPGAQVTIFKVKRTDNTLVSLVNEGTADNNGFYSNTFISDENYYYYTTAQSGSYLIANYEIINRGRENNIEVKLARPGYLSIHLKNTSPFDTNDVVNIFNSNYYLTSQIFTGNSIDTTIIITAYGNQSNPVNWKVTKNDTTITYNQTFNYISLDTISFDLFY